MPYGSDTSRYVVLRKKLAAMTIRGERKGLAGITDSGSSIKKKKINSNNSLFVFYKFFTRFFSGYAISGTGIKSIGVRRNGSTLLCREGKP